jgi:hypothetical protein
MLNASYTIRAYGEANLTVSIANAATYGSSPMVMTMTPIVSGTVVDRNVGDLIGVYYSPGVITTYGTATQINSVLANAKYVGTQNSVVGESINVSVKYAANSTVIESGVISVAITPNDNQKYSFSLVSNAVQVFNHSPNNFIDIPVSFSSNAPTTQLSISINEADGFFANGATETGVYAKADNRVHGGSSNTNSTKQYITNLKFCNSKSTDFWINASVYHGESISTGASFNKHMLSTGVMSNAAVSNSAPVTNGITSLANMFRVIPPTAALVADANSYTYSLNIVANSSILTLQANSVGGVVVTPSANSITLSGGTAANTNLTLATLKGTFKDAPNSFGVQAVSCVGTNSLGMNYTENATLTIGTSGSNVNFSNSSVSGLDEVDVVPTVFPRPFIARMFDGTSIFPVTDLRGININRTIKGKHKLRITNNNQLSGFFTANGVPPTIFAQPISFEITDTLENLNVVLQSLKYIPKENKDVSFHLSVQQVDTSYTGYSCEADVPLYYTPFIKKGVVAMGENYITTSNAATSNAAVGPSYAYLGDVAMAAAGTRCFAFITPTGDLYTWGIATNGSLGRTGVATIPQKVAGTNWRSVSCGADFMIATKNDGTLWAWGDNAFGKTGLGSDLNAGSASYSTPTQVGSSTTWSTIHACGDDMAFAVNGTSVYSWGRTSYIGRTPSGFNYSYPVICFTPATAPTKLAAGGLAAALITTNGNLYTCGDNTNYITGRGTSAGITASFTAVYNGNATDKFDQVCLGKQVSIGLVKINGVSDGVIYGWGANPNSSLGITANTNISTPTAYTLPVVAGNWPTFSGVACTGSAAANSGVSIFQQGLDPFAQFTLSSRHLIQNMFVGGTGNNLGITANSVSQPHTVTPVSKLPPLPNAYNTLHSKYFSGNDGVLVVIS